jgi:hypothetical protein
MLFGLTAKSAPIFWEIARLADFSLKRLPRLYVQFRRQKRRARQQACPHQAEPHGEQGESQFYGAAELEHQFGRSLLGKTKQEATLLSSYPTILSS